MVTGSICAIPLQRIVEAAQEIASRLRVIFPGILAVEDDGYHRILARFQNRLRRILNVLDEVIGGVLRGHAGVYEADQVRQPMVAEDHVHPGVVLLVAINVVQPLGAVDPQMVAVVAREVVVERAPQDAFVGRHPLDAFAAGQLQGLLRHAALRRPQPLRPHAEQRLVRIQRSPDLRGRVVGMLEVPRRQRQAGRRLRAGIGVAQQRQDGMVVRRGRQLDRSALWPPRRKPAAPSPESPAAAQSPAADRRA